MDNVLLCIDIILPFFVLMLIGVCLRKAQIFSISTIGDLQKFIFKVLLPVVSFNLAYSADFSTIKDNRLLIIYGTSFLVIYSIIVISILIWLKTSKEQKASFALSLCVNNMVMFGLPIAISFCGNENMSPVSALFTIVMPLSYFIGVIILQLFSDVKTNLKSIILGIIRNPIVLGLLLGYAFNIFVPNLPTALDSIIESLSNVNSPLVFLCLGASLDLHFNKDEVRRIIIIVIIKLILIPAIGIIVGATLGLRGVSLFAIIAAFANPTAASSYPLVCSAGYDGKFINSIITLSNIISLFTIFLAIVICSSVGLI